MAFAADDDGEGSGKGRLVDILAVHGGATDPESFFFQRFQGLGNVGDTRHWHI